MQESLQWKKLFLTSVNTVRLKIFLLNLKYFIKANMAKTATKISKQENPFLTSMTNGLWEKLDKSRQRVSKEEMVKRINKIKEKDS